MSGDGDDDSEKCKLNRFSFMNIPDCVKRTFVDSWNDLSTMNDLSVESFKNLFLKNDRYVYIIGLIVLLAIIMRLLN